MTCDQFSGWGEGPYGGAEWGGPMGLTPGGPIPTVAPFGVYCVGPCGPITLLTSYDEVTEVYATGQIVTTFPSDDDLRLVSGGAVSAATASVRINKAPTANWTLEVSFRFQDLPADLLDLVSSHAYVGVASNNSSSAGFFFSQSGILYTGGILHGAGNVLVLNQPTQLLPDSMGVVQEGVYYTLRVAVEESTRTTYVYLTESELLPLTGHQLRYILPSVVIGSAFDTPVVGTHLSVRGTAMAPTTMDFNSICLGDGLLIPNLPPVASAGRDFAARQCSILKLNGELSYDPEGVGITYKWRLVDAPVGSQDVSYCDDATTTTPTPLTNKVYSAQLSAANVLDPIVAGDVLQIAGSALDVATTGTDGGGFYITVTTFAIPAPSSNVSAKLLRKRGLVGHTTAHPTYYAGKSGVYRFSLVVSDGQYASPASDVVASVMESEVPRGITPDLSFIWGYLSNFWQMVDDKESIEVLWSALAQVTASELLSVWQHDYSKGLRDIPKLFQRRWLHYDMGVAEPFPDLTRTQYLVGGVLSGVIPSGGIDLTGRTVNMVGGLVGSKTVYFHGGTITPAQVQEQLQLQLGSSFKVELLPYLSDYKVRVTSELYFEFASGTATLFTYPSVNAMLSGTGGAAMGSNVYRVGVGLAGLGVSDGDYLVLGGVAHRIVRVLSDAADPYQQQRVLLYSEIGISPGTSWSINRPTTSSYLDFYNLLATKGDVAYFRVYDGTTGQTTTAPAEVLSAPQYGLNSELLVDFSPLLLALEDPSRYTVHLTSVLRRTYIPVDSLVQEIPYLQEKIKNAPEESVLRQNIDFFLESYRGTRCIRFSTAAAPSPDVWQHVDPPQRMWAEVTYLDNRPTVEAQFGLPVSFTLDDLASLPPNSDYLSVVRGLWHSHLAGPTVQSLRTGAHILLGLPFAEEAGVVEELEPNFSVTHGRLLVRDNVAPRLVRSYTYPSSLPLETNPTTGKVYAVGDSVDQFAVLVKGVELTDYVSTPEWWLPYQQQGVFYEVEKFFKFLVRVDSAAFSLPTLLFVKQFINRVKPSYTYPMFMVRKNLSTPTVNTTDSIRYNVKLRLFDSLCNDMGIGRLFDDPDPSGGGFTSQVDSAAPFGAAPVPSVSSPVVFFGLDREMLCPQDYIVGSACMTLGAPTPAALDGIYLLDSGLFTSTLLDEGTPNILAFLPTPGTYLGRAVTAGGGYTLTALSYRFDASFAGVGPYPVTFVIEKNGSTASTIATTIPTGSTHQAFLTLPAPVSVIAGDVIRVRVFATGGVALSTDHATVSVRLGAFYVWTLDADTPAGTYCVGRSM